jgi:hypothetical protein
VEIEAKIDLALSQIKEELLKATAKFGPFASAHEGYAVIKEEVDELWDDVKANLGYGPSAYTEAKQVAAMAARFMVDIGSRG